MQKINKPADLKADADQVTFIRHDGGWVVHIKTDVEVCGCVGPDQPMEFWYQLMDEDDLDGMMDYLIEGAVTDVAEEPEDDGIDVEDSLDKMFKQGFTDGR